VKPGKMYPPRHLALERNYSQKFMKPDNWSTWANDVAELLKQLNWLEADLAASTAIWKIVWVHHPLGGSPDKDEAPGDNYWDEVIDRLRPVGLDVFIAGHSHTYHRSFPLTGSSGSNATFVNDTDNDYEKGVGLVQVVTGTGGRSLRSGSFPNFIAEGRSTSTGGLEYGFTRVDVTPSQLTFRYIHDDNGAVEDTFTITNPAVAPGPPSNPSPTSGSIDFLVNDDLSWTPGSDATTHDVYFGTDPTPDAGELKGNQVLTTYDPGQLNASTTYYWQIVERNHSGTASGPVWNFTTEAAIAPLAQTFLQRVVVGSEQNFELPVYATAPSGDSDRLFLAELRTGRIEILDLSTETPMPTSFLEISGLGTENEQGLLGLAFDPDYANNGFFYVQYVRADYTVQIERYRVQGDPATSNVADPSSAHTILSIQQPFEIHNAGWIGFGPNDGMLYIPTGDGGDPVGPQQITGNLRGKILRIDVSGDDFPTDDNRNYAIPNDNPFVDQTGEDEIWAYGLRNPFRASFDRATGDLWIGDVGKANRDEIDLQRAGSTGEENYGWSFREGTIATPTDLGGPPPPGNVEPVYDYEHDGPDPDFAGSSVVGGYVYHGTVPRFQGHYFFGDYISKNIWKLDPDAVDMRASVTNVLNLLSPDAGGLGSIASFAEDAAGELYLLELGGGDVFRLVTASKDVVWNGDDVSAVLDNVPGDGTSWSDANNWTRDGMPNVGTFAEDHVIFAPGSSQPLVVLGDNPTVSAVTFQSSYELQSNRLTVLSGNVTVEEGVTVTSRSELAAETANHSLRKLGPGTLLIEGHSGQMAVKEGTLGGSGSIDHLTVREGATVAPGDSTGILQVDNSFTMWPGANLEIELGGALPGTQHDQLDITGAAVLDGTLNVSLVDLGGALFDPGMGDSFEILTALGGITGMFETTALPSIQEGLFWDVQYMEFSMELNVLASGDLDGDLDGDGDVDQSDLVQWENGFGLGSDADTDGDGDSDGADFLVVQQQYTDGPPFFYAVDFDEDGDVDVNDLVSSEGDFGLNHGSDVGIDGDGADFLMWQGLFNSGIAQALPIRVPEPTSTLLWLGCAILGMLWRPWTS